MSTKIIEVAGKRYTLTATRKIVQTLNEICPELLRLGKNVKAEELAEDFEVDVGVKILCNLDVLFYDMIKIAHPEITKEKSDEILDLFDAEYDDVQTNLVNFAMSVFQEGNPNKSKKKLDW